MKYTITKDDKTTPTTPNWIITNSENNDEVYCKSEEEAKEMLKKLKSKKESMEITETMANSEVISRFFNKDFSPVGSRHLYMSELGEGNWKLVNYSTPIAYYNGTTDKWYINKQKYSVTTSKIQNYIRSIGGDKLIESTPDELDDVMYNIEEPKPKEDSVFESFTVGEQVKLKGTNSTQIGKITSIITASEDSDAQYQVDFWRDQTLIRQLKHESELEKIEEHMNKSVVINRVISGKSIRHIVVEYYSDGQYVGDAPWNRDTTTSQKGQDELDRRELEKSWQKFSKTNTLWGTGTLSLTNKDYEPEWDKIVDEMEGYAEEYKKKNDVWAIPKELEKTAPELKKYFELYHKLESLTENQKVSESYSIRDIIETTSDEDSDDMIRCPHCGDETVLSTRNSYDNKTGETVSWMVPDEQKCSSCDEIITDRRYQKHREYTGE